VFTRTGTADDLRRVLPLTPAILDALHIADAATLAPLARGGGGNSDYYPTLDLGAERTRFMNQGAEGFVGLAGERFSIAPLFEARRRGVVGEPYDPIGDIPRLSSMQLAAQLRDRRFVDAPTATLAVAERVRAFDRLIASNDAPLDWRVFVASALETESARSGGAVGVADSAFFAGVRRYMSAHDAPAQARASIDFVHGLASWDFTEASRAAEFLLPLAVRGEHWITPDLLREGTTVARLRAGDPRGARVALESLRGASGRGKGDLRAELLSAWVSQAEQAAQTNPTE